MDIKEVRQKTGLSQSEFAERFEIPVRTLQQWEQHRSEAPTYLVRMMNTIVDRDKVTTADQDKIKKNDYISDYRIPKKNDWKICIPNPFQNCEKIHSLQQRKVASLLESIKDSDLVEKVIIFGSSVTEMCHIGSDVDVYMQMKKDKNPITENLDFEIDFWNNFRVDERLRKEIEQKGVTVYG